MKTEHKLYVVEGFKGKKISQINVNEHLLDDICLHKSTPFFSGMSSTAWNLNLFLRPRDRTLQLRSEVFDARDPELVQHDNVHA